MSNQCFHSRREASPLKGSAAAVTLHCGIHAAVSIVGTEDHGGALVAQGEAPTCAISLQRLAGANEVLLSESVRRAATSRFVFSPCTRAEPLRVAGGQRLAVSTLVGTAGMGAPGTPSAAANGKAVLVGRDVEVAHLLSVVQSTQHGAPHVMVLTGAVRFAATPRRDCSWPYCRPSVPCCTRTACCRGRSATDPAMRPQCHH